jgi:PAS domain S-box-containing protein
VRPRAIDSPHAAELFRLLVETVVDHAIFLLDENGCVLTWNVGAERIKGYRADEIVGQHFSVFYTPEDREAGRPAWVLGRAGQHGRVEDEGWRVRKDGTRFRADVSVTAIRGPDGKPTGYAKVTRDVTERHAAAERERQLQVEREARRVAEDAIRARDRFLSIASHELRTPIATVQIVAEALLRAHRADSLDRTRLVKGLARMDASVQRLGTLLNELLDVSRLTAGPRPLTLEPTDIGALVEEVVRRFEDTEHGDRIELGIEPDVTAPADATRMDQVVTNLVDNALRYSSPPQRVKINVRPADDGVEIVVRDEGIGFDSEAESVMFESFGRGEAASPVPGLGLGLYISQQIVDAHGGRITASSDGPGTGSTFSVWLPAATDGADDER